MKIRRKAQTFWYVFKHSLIPADDYYKHLHSYPFSFSLRYFLSGIFLAVLLAVCVKTIVFVRTFPPDQLRTYITKTEESFPQNFLVEINELGHLSSHTDKPFIIFSPVSENPMPLLVIDPKATADKIYEYGSFALFTEQELVVRQPRSYHTYPYTPGESLTVDKRDISQIAQNARELTNAYWLVALVGFVGAVGLGTVGMSMSYIFSVLFASLVYYLLLRIIRRKDITRYKDVLHISLHAVTAPILIQVLAFIFNIVPSIDSWFAIVTYIFLGGALYEAYFAAPEKKRRSTAKTT